MHVCVCIRPMWKTKREKRSPKIDTLRQNVTVVDTWGCVVKFQGQGSIKRCRIGWKLVVSSNRKSHMNFWMTSKSVTQNDLERRERDTWRVVKLAQLYFTAELILLLSTSRLQSSRESFGVPSKLYKWGNGVIGLTRMTYACWWRWGTAIRVDKYRPEWWRKRYVFSENWYSNGHIKKRLMSCTLQRAIAIMPYLTSTGRTGNNKGKGLPLKIEELVQAHYRLCTHVIMNPRSD